MFRVTPSLKQPVLLMASKNNSACEISMRREPYVGQGVLGVVLDVAAVVRHRVYGRVGAGSLKCLDQPAIRSGERSNAAKLGRTVFHASKVRRSKAPSRHGF